MKHLRVLVVVLATLASSALYAQHDYNAGGGSTPDSDTNFIRTGTPCELGTDALSVSDLAPDYFFVRAGDESGKTYNFYGDTNFDCRDGKGVRWTSKAKKLKYGEVLVARWDANTCAWDYNSLRIKKCYKTKPGNPDQVFRPDASRPLPPLVIARDFDNRVPVCNRQAAPVVQYVAPVAAPIAQPVATPTDFTVTTLEPDSIGKTSALLHGSFTAAESRVPYVCRFAWGRVSKGDRPSLNDLDNYTSMQQFYSYGYGGIFEAPLTNLDFNANYAYAAACKQDGFPGVKYGEIVEFSLRRTGWFERHPVLGSIGIGLLTYGVVEGIRSINRPNSPPQMKPPDKVPCHGRCAPADQHPRGPAWPGHPPTGGTPVPPGCTTCNQQPGPAWPGTPNPGNPWPPTGGTNPTPPGSTTTPPGTTPTGPGTPWGGH